MALVQKYFSWRDVDEIPKIKTSPRHQEDVLARALTSWPHTSTWAASRAPDDNYVV
jgi:hypothetical protein